jgi:hypothetical protein
MSCLPFSISTICLAKALEKISGLLGLIYPKARVITQGISYDLKYDEITNLLLNDSRLILAGLDEIENKAYYFLPLISF